MRDLEENNCMRRREEKRVQIPELHLLLRLGLRQE
jgi:hypothetical protein